MDAAITADKKIKFFLMRNWVPLVAIVIVIAGLDNLCTGLYSFFIGHSLKFVTVINLEQSSNVLSIVIGAVLIFLGRGLWKQQFVSWILALIFLVFAFANAALPQISIHSMVLSAFFIMLLLFNRDHFYSQGIDIDLIKTLIAWCSVLFSITYGAIGSYLLRDQFQGIHSFIDAIYFTFVTYSTVGYGDIFPVTMNAKIFTMTMIVVGLGSFLAALSTVVGPIIQRNTKGIFKMVRKLRQLEGHALVCGDNLLTRALADGFKQQGRTCFFIENDAAIVARLHAEGYHAMQIDAMNADELHNANVPDAFCFIASLEEDASNILLTMTAKGLCTETSKVRIVARIEHAFNIEKAKRVGADEVISPFTLSAQKILQQLLMT